MMKTMDFLLEKVPLFRGLQRESVRCLLEEAGSREIAYEKGDFLVRSGETPEGLLILLEGRAQVRKGELVLRELSPGDLTGVSALFGEEARMETDITAAGRLKLLFLPRTAVAKALARDPLFAQNYIAFLSSRIRFLNGLIGRFSGGDVTERTLYYLLEQAKIQGPSFPFSPTRAAAELGVGRASLYRALDQLKGEGFLEREKGRIIVKNPETFQHIYG